MTRETLRRLHELRRLLDFENENGANFDMLYVPPLGADEPYPERPMPCGEMPLPRNGREVDAFVKERTRLWRQTWVLPVLDELISKGEAGRG